MTAPRLTPFPLSAAASSEPVLSIPFGDWDENGWAKTGDAEIIGWWSDPAESDRAYIHGNNGLGTWFDGLPPARRSTQIAKTFAAALTPSRRYRFEVRAAWSLAQGRDPATFTGIEINGVRGFLPGAIFGDPGRTFNIFAEADGSGDVEVIAMLEDIPTSASWDATFFDIDVYPAADVGDLADIYYDAGVLYIGGQAFSITRGGITFDPQEEWEDYDFPGKGAPVEGLEELVRSRPVLRTTAMLTGEYQHTVYHPGGAWADHAAIAGARTFTPSEARAVVTTGLVLHEVVAVWPRARGDYIAVEFPRAVCRRYGMGSKDKDEGEIPIEIEARIASGEPITTTPYLIHTYPAGTTLGDE